MTSISEAIAQREEAIASVDAGANDEWKKLMTGLLTKVAKRKQFFTSTDVFYELEKLGELPKSQQTHDNRAFGAVIRKAVKSGICKKTDRFEASTRRHMTPCVVWQSMIFAANDNTAPVSLAA